MSGWDIEGTGLDPASQTITDAAQQPSGWDFGPASDQSILVNQSDGSGTIFYEPVSSTWANSEGGDYNGIGSDSFMSNLKDLFGWAQTSDGKLSGLGSAALMLAGGVGQSMMLDKKMAAEKQMADDRIQAEKDMYDKRIANRAPGSVAANVSNADQLLASLTKGRSIAEGGTGTGLLSQIKRT